MQIKARYFAIVREIMGKSGEPLDLPDGATVADAFDVLVQREPRLAAMGCGLVFMVNHQYAERGQVLANGDEFAAIPPVSGGDHARYRVQSEPLDQRQVEALLADPGAGAVVTFVGQVRDHARGRTVTALDYEVYAEAAEPIFARIGEEMAERWQIRGSAIVHRSGYVTPGEASVVIVVTSAHRGDAFAACAHAIERIKELAPIWKKEFYADGETWVGSEAHYQNLVRGEKNPD